MTESYSVRTVSNKGIKYRDERDVYRFDVDLVNKKWTVYLPCSKGDYYQIHELTDDEQRIILPRIKKHLERKLLGFIGPSYQVTFEREKPVSPAMEKVRLATAKYWERKRKQSKK